jgi:hypothetical protein
MEGGQVMTQPTITNIGWQVYKMPSEVAPINDLKPHEIGGECWCNPFMDGDVIVHNALDRREYTHEKGILQ